VGVGAWGGSKDLGGGMVVSVRMSSAELRWIRVELSQIAAIEAWMLQTARNRHALGRNRRRRRRRRRRRSTLPQCSRASSSVVPPVAKLPNVACRP